MRVSPPLLLAALLTSSCTATTSSDKEDAGGGLQLSIISGDQQHAAADTHFSTPLQVQVLNNGQPYPSARVHFTAPRQEPTAIFNSMNMATSDDAVTSSSGIAVAPPLKAGRMVGTYTLIATVDQTDLHAEFTLSNTVGAPSGLFVVSGDDQTAVTGTAFMPFRVILKDATGNPVPGDPVTFSTPSTGATCAFDGDAHTASVMTDTGGVATAPACTASMTTGDFDVTLTGPLASITETMTLHVAAE